MYKVTLFENPLYMLWMCVISISNGLNWSLLVLRDIEERLYEHYFIDKLQLNEATPKILTCDMYEIVDMKIQIIDGDHKR